MDLRSGYAVAVYHAGTQTLSATILHMSATRFIRTSWFFSANQRLDIGSAGPTLRRIGKSESETMREQVRRRNVFARHSYENDFYIKRIQQLAGQTVIEFIDDGPIDAILSGAHQKADLFERLVLLSSVFGTRRSRTHQDLAITRHRRAGFYLAATSGFRYLRSSAKKEPTPRGISIGATFVRRFHRLGFTRLYDACLRDDPMGTRLNLATSWLAESRIEADLKGAAVKTAIALESLLIGGETEPLRGSISERAAFLLSHSATRRKAVSAMLKRYYDLRSSIVHGGRRKRGTVTENAIEAADRISVLTALTLASDPRQFGSIDAVVTWVDSCRWGESSGKISRPFPDSYLTRALAIGDDAFDCT